MDDIYRYIIGGVLIAILIIVVNKKRQNSRVTDFLKDVGDTQPVFMQQAIEKKLKTLKIALYNSDAAGNDVISSNAAKKQFLKDELNRLEKEYANGGVTLKAYDDQLHRLIMQLSK